MKEHKGYYVKPHKVQPRHYVVVTKGQGGKIPAILGGMFTSPTIAIQAIDMYMNSKPKVRGKQDGSETRAEI